MSSYNIYILRFQLLFEHLSVFKIAVLVHKFLQIHYPKYFGPDLKPRPSVYNTLRSQADGVVLGVP